MTDDPRSLLAALLRCLDEDEQVAKAAGYVETGPSNNFEPEWKPSWSLQYETVVIAGEAWTQTDDHVCNTDDSVAYANHIVRWDPSRVLQVVAAHRKLLELHEITERPQWEYTGTPEIRVENGRTIRHWGPGSITGQKQVGSYFECGFCRTYDEAWEAWPCPTVEILLDLYRDRLGSDD